jgi:hypothetical protein
MPRFVVEPATKYSIPGGEYGPGLPRLVAQKMWRVIDTAGEGSPNEYKTKKRAQAKADALNAPRDYPAGSIGAVYAERNVDA